MRTLKKLAAGAAVVSALTLTAACGADDEPADAGDAASSASTPTDDTTDDVMDPAANLVGPGCADYAATVPEGEGSVAGMAEDPVAVAAGNNPLLTTLTAAVSGQLNPDVNLVDTLNGDEFTVFAPTDDAFAKLDAKTVETLKTDSELLTSILTYHVVAGQIEPAELAGTTQTTLQGGDVEVTGSGDELVVNDANVVCGGVMTQNATVYLIDTVLLP